MKSLRNILYESILDVNGPAMLDDNKLVYTIYESLQNLPKTNKVIYGRICYDESVSKKFNRPIINELKKLIKSDKLKERKVNTKIDKPGVAIKLWPGDSAIVVAWDKNDYILTKVEEFKGVCWTILYENWSNWQFTYLQEILEDSGINMYYIPCHVDMQLIKKIYDSKK